MRLVFDTVQLLELDSSIPALSLALVIRVGNQEYTTTRKTTNHHNKHHADKLIFVCNDIMGFKTPFFVLLSWKNQITN